MVDSPFRHKSARELPTNYLQLPSVVMDNLIANVWRLIQDVATDDGVILGIVPNEVIPMMGKVLLVSGREGDLKSVQRRSFDNGKHGLVIELAHKYLKAEARLRAFALDPKPQIQYPNS